MLLADLAFWFLFASGIAAMLVGSLMIRPSTTLRFRRGVGARLLGFALLLGGIAVLASITVPEMVY